MTPNNTLRTVLTIIMDALVVIAMVEVFRMIVLFFGQLSSQAWAQALVTLSDPLTIPFGIEDISTQYAGVFDMNAAVSVVALLMAEWALSIVRPRRVNVVGNQE